MSIFSRLFAPSFGEIKRQKSEIDFWRNKSLSFERKLEIERERNRTRERMLIDRVLEARGLNPIKSRAEAQTSAAFGFETVPKRPKTDAEIQREKQCELFINRERAAFIQSSVAGGISHKEAAAYFDQNKDKILSQII